MMKEPVRASGRCIADTTYATVMMYALYFLIVRGLIDARIWAFPVAGALTGLAYLTRTEGLMVLPFGLVFVVAGAIRKKLPSRTALAGGVLMLVISLGIAAFHVGLVSVAEGRFTLRRNVGQLMLYTIGATHEIPPSVGKGPTAREVIGSPGLGLGRALVCSFSSSLFEYIPRCGGYITGVFIVAGLAACWRKLWRWEPNQIGLAMFVFSLGVLSLVGPHTRFLIATVPLTGYLMACGVDWLWQQGKRIPIFKLNGAQAAPTVVSAVMIGAVLAITLSSTITYDRYRDRELRHAGAIIAANTPPGAIPRIAVHEAAVAWYANGDRIGLGDEWTLTSSQLQDFLERHNAGFVVVESPQSSLGDQDTQKPPPFLRLIDLARPDPRSSHKTPLAVYRFVRKQ